MNIVNTGTTYRIFDESLKTFDSLPNGTYEIGFHPMQGFWLTKVEQPIIKEAKIYGNSPEKVDKVFRGFANSNRNFGVILSGPKGVGKSLFAQLVARKAYDEGIPLILVNSYINGIADFLGSIRQEVVVIFDEFEKTFAKNDDENPQDEMLTLFDGMDSGKKLFIITCNDTYKLNEYMLNRPGRFHYHFAMSNPEPDEIREYLTDKLEAQYHDLIESVVAFSMSGSITYDCLRAISFELNNGYSIEETVADLNISRDRENRMRVIVDWSDGSHTETSETINLFQTYSNCVWFYGYGDGEISVGIRFYPRDIVLNDKKNGYTIDVKNVHVSWDDDDFYGYDDEKITEYKNNHKPVAVNFFKDKNTFTTRYLV